MSETAAAAVILAAGAGSRCGGPKGLLEVRGHTFLEILVRSLADADISRVVVVVGAEADRVRWRHRHLGARVQWLANAAWATSDMLASLQLGLRSITPDRLGATLVWPVDCPFDDPPLVRSLLAAASADVFAAVPRHRCEPGHPVVLSKWGASAMCGVDARPLREMLAKHAASLAFVDTDNDAVLHNINDAEALATLDGHFDPPREPGGTRRADDD